MNAPEVTATFRILATPGVRRTGVKGREAAAALRALGVPVPAAANQVARFGTAASGRCLRLGNTEFLIEQDAGDDLTRAIEDYARDAPTGILSALRRDRCVVLAGAGLFPALRQLAAFDFEAATFDADAVVMTLMAGISVTFIREPAQGSDALRLWCDPGFGDYFHDCLVALGGQAGTDAFPLPFEPQGPTP